ncbi:hypothetical protein LZ31DRAFT_192864 [Colletotrichum somersetense]|nr:hypothetical protein LZ31DRAFT_192864 [Colletotrichum somersetense]
MWWVDLCHCLSISAVLLIRCASARHESAMPFPLRNGFQMGRGCRARSNVDNLKHPSQGQSTSHASCFAFFLFLGDPFWRSYPAEGGVSVLPPHEGVSSESQNQNRLLSTP